MFSVYYVCAHSDITLARYRLERRAPYIFPPTVIAKFIKERLSSSLEHWYGPEKLRRRLKLAWGLAKMPYYIEACLLRSPYFVTFATL